MKHSSPLRVLTTLALALAPLGVAPGQPAAPTTPRFPSRETPGASGIPAPHTPAYPAALESDDDTITFADFSEGIELGTLVDLVARTLEINISVKGTLSGSVVFNAPVRVKKDKLLALLDSMLEQWNYTLVRDELSGFYRVVPIGELSLDVASHTKIIPTPNTRPSALKAALEAQLDSEAPATPQQGGAAARSGRSSISYIDELGVIVVTDSPRRLAAVQSFVDRLLQEGRRLEYTRLELRYVSAPIARERALQLVGQGASGSSRGAMDGQEPQVTNQRNRAAAAAQNGQAGTMDNLPDRLVVSPQGNALIFRGTAEEIEQVRGLVAMIDVDQPLEPRLKRVGAAARSIADMAKQRGLGEVVTVEPQSTQTQTFPYFGRADDGRQRQNQQAPALAGGPVMVVDEQRGTILYYATNQQHKLLDDLVDQLSPEADLVVIRSYKLEHGDAEKMTALILGLLQNRTPTDTTGSPLLPGTSAPAQGAQGSPSTIVFQGPDFGSRSQDESLLTGKDSFVVADKVNNQVLVKAPQKQQAEFERLIRSLDRRRPQVYIEAKIVSVTSSDDFRLAFETQLINAGGAGGVLNTNFGLSSFPTGSGINQPKRVSTGLQGLTAALIKSDQVPIIITALQKEVDTRILSAPQLLVDDNETAKIVSTDQQPTTTTTIGTGGNPNTTTFAGYEDAGTTLEITPHISGDNYLRLKYSAILSSFTGVATSDGIPPPKQVNEINSNSVQVPSNMTVILGGLTVDSNSRTVVKVPLLGDIPIVGQLFSDDSKRGQKTTLYVFLTPKIIRDEHFEDLRLLTGGPQNAAKIARDLPPLEPVLVDVFGAEPVTR